MKKVLCKLMLVLAVIAMGIPCMTGQTASRQKAPVLSALTTQEAPPSDPRVTLPQMFVRPDGGAGHGIRSMVCGNLPLPTLGDQIRKATGGVEIWGYVETSDKPEGASKVAHKGVWKVDLSSNFSPLLERDLGGCYSAVIVDSIYYFFTITDLGSYKLPVNYGRHIGTWESVKVPEVTYTTDIPYALCTDGYTVWGQFYKDNKYIFGTYDLTKMKHTAIAECEGQWNAMAYGNDGNIYAIDMSGKLLQVVPKTGATTLIGATGYLPKYFTGATIEPKSGRMFWTICTEDKKGALLEVNLTTGAATKLCDFQYNDQMSGIVAPFVPNAKAPGAITNFFPHFTLGNLSGKLSFKCPTTHFDGSAAAGELTYKILSNGKEIATGKTAFGAEVNVDVTVPEAGLYKFHVILTNDAGEGPKANVTTYVGDKVPKTPKVTIAYDNDKFNISWTPVTETVNGGLIEPGKVTYTVTRYPGEVVVAENTTATSLVDPLAAPARYTEFYYTVVAKCDGFSSAPGKSSIVGLGEVMAPYKETFDTEASLKNWTIIDANNDGKKWAFYSGSGEQAVRAAYNSKNSMDDWLISPSITLEAGKSYKVSIDVRNSSATYQERFEIKMGNAPTVEAMTTVVIDSTLLDKTKNWTTYDHLITPATTGKYYFGIHGISDKDKYYLYADNFTISEPLNNSTPAEVTELTATPDMGGALKAVISGKAPLNTVTGQTLTALDKIVISRDSVEVKTITGIQPGETFSFTDENMTRGAHTWSVVCHNSNGAGNSANVTAFVGINKPAAPTNVQMTETSNGKVHISWTAPTQDIDGKPLDASELKYIVVNASNPAEVYAQDVTGTTLDHTLFAEGQNFQQVAVAAVNNAGVSIGAVGPFMAIGFPYTTPYLESFTNSTIKYILGIWRINGNTVDWATRRDNEIPGLTCADGDNGMISGQMRAQNDASMIFTGKIDLNNMINPAFSFYTFNIVGHRNNSIQNDLNEIDVKIREVGTEEWTLLKHGSVNELCGGDTAVWKKISVNLAAYKGKMVQVGLQATCKNFVWMLFDRLELTEDLGHNLKAVAINAPKTAKPNKEFDIMVDVKNLGSQEATDYSVEFYRGDATTPFATVNGSPLASEMDTIFTAPYKLTFADEDANVTFKAVVKYNADENQSDNTSETVTVTRKYSQKPAPKNLKGKHEGGNIRLSWTAPDFPSTQQRMATDVSDDLESYTSWTDSLVGGWTFVDKDQGPRGGFKGMTIPNVPLKSKGSWFVFKQGGDFNMSYHAHSGTQFFASLFNYDISQVDDWCISPELSGYAQTMKFWARSYSTDYLEKMEVLYSTTDKNPDHFTSRGIVDGVPGEWTEFNCELPAGTKYFAIRNCGTDKFMLMLDDFTFESAGVTLAGYNIYRDNVKVNSEVIPATTTNYLVPSITGTHTYHVTAVYTSGDESAPAGTTLGVEDIDASVNVIAGHGTISVFGADGKQVTIVGTNGITFFNNVAKNDIVVKVLPGVYMVRVADDNYKIVVK